MTGGRASPFESRVLSVFEGVATGEFAKPNVIAYTNTDPLFFPVEATVRTFCALLAFPSAGNPACA